MARSKLFRTLNSSPTRRLIGILLLGFANLSDAIPRDASNSIDAQMDSAKIAIRTRQYELAHKLLSELAESGDSEAQYLLASLYNSGKLYSSGKSARQDYQARIVWLSQAAKQNHSKAQYELGTHYETGKGAEINIETALSWYKKAAESGHSKAQARIDKLSSSGLTGGSPGGESLDNIFQLIRKNDLHGLKLLLRTRPGTKHDIEAADKYGTTPLIYAVQENRQTFIKLLVSKGVSSNHQNLAGQSALIIAAKYNRVGAAETLLKYMLQQKANINSKDKRGNSAFHIASRKHHFEIAKRILSAGGNPNIINNKGETVLDIAIDGNNRELAGILRSQRALRNNIQPENQRKDLLNAEVIAENAMRQTSISNNQQNPFKNWPALNLAAWRGQLVQVEALLKMAEYAGPSLVDSIDEEQHTPLSRAAWQGHTEIVQLLLSAGANPSHTLANDISPLRLAIDKGHADAAKTLLQSGAQITDSVPAIEPLLTLSARKGHVGIAAELIEHGANVNAVYQGKTALMWAAKNGLNSLLKRLITAGVNLDYPDIEGRTALWFAVSENQLSAVKLLLGAGADYSFSDKSENSPLALAARSGELLIVQLLLQTAVDVNRPNSQQNTPLMLAARNGNVKVMDVLIKKGADVTLRNKTSYTALMLAAENGQLSAVKLLIAHGADPRRKNSVGKNSGELAVLAKQDTVSSFIDAHSQNTGLFDVFR